MHCLNCSEQLCSNLLAGSQFLDPDGWFPNHVSMHVQRSHLPCSSECLSGSLAATCSTQCSGARGSLSAVSAYLSRASGSPFHRLPHDSAATWSSCSSLARPPGGLPGCSVSRCRLFTSPYSEGTAVIYFSCPLSSGVKPFACHSMPGSHPQCTLHPRSSTVYNACPCRCPTLRTRQPWLQEWMQCCALSLTWASCWTRMWTAALLFPVTGRPLPRTATSPSCL